MISNSLHLQHRTVARSRAKRKFDFNNFLTLGVIWLMCFCYLMLPLERGFKNLNVGPYAIPLSIIISGTSFLILCLVSKNAVLKRCHGFYVWGQCVVSLVFFIAALRAEIPLASIAIAAQYFCIWVLNYLSLRYILESKYRVPFINIVCSVAAIAAIIGIVEGAFSLRLPMYQYWAQVTYGEGSRLDILEKFDRVIGTLGHFHIYSTALLLMIPFACELNKRVFKNILLGLIIVAALLTVSRTVVVFLCIYMLGCLVIYRRKAWGIIPVLLLLLVLLSGVNVAQYSNVPFIALWGQRLNLIVGGENLYADQNVQGRYDMWSMATESFIDQGPVNQLIGSGIMSSVKVSESFNNAFATLDNTYITMIYEEGIIGFTAFAFVFLVLLWRLRMLALTSLHWYAILGLLIIAQTFVITTYATFNFISVASIAWMLSLYSAKKPPIKNQITKNKNFKY